MRKNFLYYMFAVICSVSLFAACSDDDDDEVESSSISEIVGTYEGTMDIYMGTVALVEGDESSIAVTEIDDDNVNISWSGTLEIYGWEIALDVDCDCAAELSDDGSYTLEGTTTTDITTLGYTDLEVNVTGTATEESLVLEIDVPTVVVVVEFSGTK